MRMSMLRALQLHALGLVLILSLIWQWTASGSGAAAAFAAGAFLFSLNLWLLVGLGQRFLGRLPAKKRRSGLGFLPLVLLGVKVLLLGAGAYTALVVLDLRADYFVGGLVSGLVVLVALSSLARLGTTVQTQPRSGTS